MIIAEIGINHGGSMFLAKRLIREAKRNGADIAKFQLYEVDKLFPDRKIIINDKDWYKEVKDTELTYEQGKELFEYCGEMGIEFMASAFDVERVLWLEEWGVLRHKIASPVWKMPDVCNMIEQTNKPVIISVPYGREFTRLDRAKYLYCVPEYPTEIEMVDYKRMQDFDGFSDHTVGIEASCIALAMGVNIIEKHFCLLRNNMNPDMVCSMAPEELRTMVRWQKKFR